MSTGQSSRRRSASRGSSARSDNHMKPPTPSITPGTEDFAFEPCAATASFLLIAQSNVILSLHHDTLAIERRFTRHRENVSWISVDNVSRTGSGRLVASYDCGSTAIIWDLLTGDEVARFASYEQIRVAAWMSNGNVAFGNSAGSIILFEPSTSEHIAARTIFDPITALAPSADCRTFAIGYRNGSILIATLQPSFTILHTLTTPRTPSPVAGLAWHGSSSKQKSEMLAAQASDGDLRVWSVPKAAHSGDAPCVIRILNRSDQREPGPCWFAWSKNGRIVQYTEGQTCAWDVRTKRVTYETVPTIDGVAAITNYGATATLFTMGRNFSIQQYDLNPSGTPAMVANVQHPPANTPPSPPNSLGEAKTDDETPMTARPVVRAGPQLLTDSESENEGVAMSPLQRIAMEMDQIEEERKDRLGPLSPSSSRGSASSRSSGSGRAPRYRYDRPGLSARSSKSSQGTVFSSGTSLAGTSRESVSIRSTSSATSSRYGQSALRREVLRSPLEPQKPKPLDLFPFTKARLTEVPFRNSTLGPERTPHDLRQNMLRVVFGWEAGIEELVRDELARHQTGSAAAVLLSKWLGDSGADMMASMVGSDSLTSSDWMLLALSSMGHESQKKVGEAFVQRLLQKGDVHPAVAILLGLGEHNDAVEVYVSRKYYLEAILLTCLLFPTDWQRQSFLVRKWGEQSVTEGKAELAVKCFSCTGIESSEPWFSPKAQDAVYAAQHQLFSSQMSPPLSPPSNSTRVAAKLSSLKLVTNFAPPSRQMLGVDDERTPMNAGVTPIAESAITPAVGNTPWARTAREASREPSSARTATPGAYRRKRMPSRADTERSTTNNETLASLAVPNRGQRDVAIPKTAVDNYGREAETLPFSIRRPASAEPQENTALLTPATYNPSKSKEQLPSPAVGVFDSLNEKRSMSSSRSRSRKADGLYLEINEQVVEGAQETDYSNASPPLTGASVKSAKARAVDNYISSLEEASYYARQRTNSRNEQRSGSRNESRPGARMTDRARSRHRDTSESRGRSGARYIQPAKRSPSSPVPMSPEDAGIYAKSSKEASTNTESFDDERYYRVDVVSPLATESVSSFRTTRSRANLGASKVRSSSRTTRRDESPDRGATRARSRATSRTASRRPAEDRGRSSARTEKSGLKSPGSPQPMLREDMEFPEDFEPVRPRQRSTSRRPRERAASTRREPSPDRRVPRDRSVSRKPASSILRESSRPRVMRDPSPEPMPERVTETRHTRPLTLSRKELAARELEDRRLSLLSRRPSAPNIPLPGQLSRPVTVERSYTDDFLSSTVYRDPIQRSQTADPEMAKSYSPTRPTTASSTSSVPMGLPANPRAMRHQRRGTGDTEESMKIPAVPSIPVELIPPPSSAPGPAEDNLGPLLPATTFGQPPPLARSASAPPEDMLRIAHGPRISPTFPLPSGNRLGHARMNTDTSIVPNYKRVSPPPITASIDETIHDSQVVIIHEEPEAPPILAELQHLAGPPPPPSPPVQHKRNGSRGVINIAIDENSSAKPQDAVSPVSSPPASTASPSAHRRGRGSVSDNLGLTFKRVAERMRSTSRSRNKSPPSMMRADVAPYESIPEFTLPRTSSGKTPIEAKDMPFSNLSPPPPPPVQPMEQVIPPGEEMKNPQFAGYRNPKEIRANLLPETLSQSVYRPQDRPVRANMPPDSNQQGVYQVVETPTPMI
ncbi:hypothetical protein M011DRAFT_402666 [Sporormia fimetaria CBS 119925]|uniref:Gem-associated protein 5 TPR domain-containing protein n=1 Tax=Sporormia fimetaria CBS 119925 TaxID=1340428 RepID=A0A6A6VA40_9PLEO|nr:hypothetical protein M011DRAFT_402666 [Sporormia fimetaria CBS 119925]